MKTFLKIILKSILVLFLGFILVGFVYFAMQPSKPEVISKISNDENLISEFHEINIDSWKNEGGVLKFSNNTPTKQKVTLKTSLLPSEKKKKGYITTSVKVSSNFEELPDDAIIGFQLGEENSSEENQLMMGVNGKGEIVVLDGEMNELMDESIKLGDRMEMCSSEMTLSFHYYKNPDGWILFFTAKNDDSPCWTSATINKIPISKLNDPNKEISLLVYNPSQEGELWFYDWKVWNDWTPND